MGSAAREGRRCERVEIWGSMVGRIRGDDKGARLSFAVIRGVLWGVHKLDGWGVLERARLVRRSLCD